MYTQLMRTAVIALVVVAATSTGSAQSTASRLRVSVGATPMAQGDVRRIVVEGVDDGATVSATALGLPVRLGPAGSGTFEGLIGADLAQKPGAYPVVVEVTRAKGAAEKLQSTVSVSARRFPTRRLRVSPQFVEPSAEDAERMASDAKRLSDIFASVSDRRWRGPFKPPVDGASTSNFGSRSVFNGQPRAPHAGVDYAGKVGTPIAAPNAGRVVLADNLFLTGNTVVMDHGLGLFSLFAHLSQVDVHAGDELATGAPVGLVGATGRVTGPHLHWSVRVGAARVDPALLLLLGP
jgi:murein DD-endopeptidase MepM/ murein hydrolase activator NlpD